MNNHGYHTSYCTICERNTPHEDTQCLECWKFDGETIEEYNERIEEWLIDEEN
jgi:hypothetical protein